MIRTTDELVAALAAATPGTTLEIGAGRMPCPSGGFRVPSNVRLIGAWPGRNRITGGSIFLPASPNDHAFVLCAGESDPPGNVRLENLIVKGAEVAGEGCGFVLDVPGPGIPAHIEIVRCLVWGVGKDGFYLRHATRSLDVVILEECGSNRNGRHGLYLERGAWARVSGFQAIGNRGHAAHFVLSDVSVCEDCYADGNLTSPQFVIEQTMGFRFVRGAAERFYGGCGIELRGGRECVIDGTSFLSGSPADATTGIGVVGVGTDSPWIGRCLFRGVKVMTAGCGSGNTSGQDVSRY